MNKKRNAKSVRMTDEVFKTVNEYRGNGFNEKFENLVNDFICGREKMIRETELLYAHIGEKRDEMRRVQQRVRQLGDVEQRLKPLVNAVVELLEVK